MPKYQPITEKSTDIEKEQLTMELIKWLSKRNLFSDVCIYVNNKRYKSDCYQKDNNLKEINDSKICPNTFYVEDNINVKQYIEYANEKLITMSFEGPLYHAINYGNGKIEADLQKFFDKYKLYYELGYAWSLSVYEG